MTAHPLCTALTGLTVALGAIAAPHLATAGGFALTEQNAVAGGTAGASTARADDAGAAWYNPAALADGGGLRLGVGAFAAMPALHAEADDGSWRTNSESDLAVPPHLNASYATGRIAFGLAVGVPYGGGAAWPEEWAGRHEIISSRLQVVRAAPFVAGRLGPVRIAGGVHLDQGRLQIARSLDFVATEGDVRIDLSGQAIGVDVSAFYPVSSSLDLGLAYRSRSTLSLSGGADFTAPDAFDAKTADQHATADLALPDRLAGGGSFRTGPWTVLADLELSWWKVNHELAIDFENDATPDPVQRNQWQSTLALRAGAEYRLRPRTVVRGGGFLDPSPAPAATLAPSSPDSTRIGATVGVSHRLRRDLTLDAFYEYMHLLTRESANPESLDAAYGGRVQLLGLGLRLQR